MKVKLSIPDLNEITLSQYQEFLQIEEPTDEDILCVFLGLSKDSIRKILSKDIRRVSAEIGKLFTEEQKFQQTFKLDGKEFGFIPNLDEITYGENTDISTYLGDWEQMHKAMAVMYRPITMRRKGKYLIEDYEGSAKYSDLMKRAPLNVTLGAMVFFYSLISDLLKAIPNFIQREVMEHPQTLAENGAGILSYTHLLREMLEDWTQSQGFPYTSV
jgi:hypothetical protein